MENRRQVMKLLKNLLAISLVALVCTRPVYAEEHKVNKQEHRQEEVKEEALSLKDYLGIDYRKLNQSQVIELEKYFNQMMDPKLEEEKNEDKLIALVEKFNQRLREFKIPIQYETLENFIEEHHDKIKEEDYKMMVNLTSALNSLDQEILAIYENEIFEQLSNKEEEQLKIKNQINTLLDQNGYHPDEIEGQFQMNCNRIALFDVKDGKITFSNKSIQKEKDIQKLDLEAYQKAWEVCCKIIPKQYLDKITKFEINTDGYLDLMAYVIQEDSNGSTWRLGIDIRDALTSEGTLRKEFISTVVHELMHIISLNNQQLMPLRDAYYGTYTIEDGTLTKNAYLNQFYNQFWSKIIEDYEKNKNLPEEEQGEFYEKYKNQFVSEYASTQPAEDIAETFSYFVMNDKPTGNDIKDEKVRFLYNFKELVEIREYIRKNL